MTADFAAIVAQTVVEGRALAERLMTSTCRVLRKTGEYVIDPDTDSEVPEYAEVFESNCKVQARNIQTRQEEVGGRTAATSVLELHLPIAAPEIEPDDVADILTSPHDPQLVGRRFTIVGPSTKSYATARRLEITEVVS